MSEDRQYNGWSNKETWLASLWLNDDEYSQRTLRKAKRVRGGVYDQAQWLEERLRGQLEDEISTPCLWRDLLVIAFNRINWLQIVEMNEE